MHTGGGPSCTTWPAQNVNWPRLGVGNTVGQRGPGVVVPTRRGPAQDVEAYTRIGLSWGSAPLLPTSWGAG